MRGFVKKAFRLPHELHKSQPCLSPSSDALVPPFRSRTIPLGSDFFGFETTLAGNAATRAALRPSTSLGLGGQYPFSEALFPSHPRALFASNLVALRSLHSSKPASSNDAPLFSTNPNEPITTIAERGSTQLSLREPQNKAGTSNPDLPNPLTRHLTRLVLGQSTFCQRWTRSRTGVGRVRCGQ